MNYDKVFKNVQNLHKINFKQIIKVNKYDDNFSLTEDYYNFNKYVGNGVYQNGSFKYGIAGCCTKCDSNAILDKNEKWNKKDKIDYDKYYKDYRLKYVSHGSHTLDFLNAANLDKTEIQDLFKNKSWIDTPILFLMENPSIDYEIYNECENGKFPTNTWYWIHRRLQEPSNVNLDEYLKQGKYGEMVYSLICKYKLANAYLTNVIKCGLNGYKNGKDNYLGTVWYKDECKRTCINEILTKEIQMLCNGYEEIKVFAYGSNAYWLAKDYFQNSSSETLENLDIQLVQLPHPSSRLSNNFRKYVVKGIIEDVLKSKKQFALNHKYLPVVKDVETQLKKCFAMNDIEIGKRTHNDKLAIRTKTQSSLFNTTESLISEVEIIAGKNNQHLNNSVKIGYGYNFLTGEFWGWNYESREFIEYENIKTFDIFKEVIERLVL